MAKQENIEAEGTVLERLPGGKYTVQLSEDFGSAQITASASGTMRKFNISIIEGDSVRVEMSPYDISVGRIVYRK